MTTSNSHLKVTTLSRPGVWRCESGGENRHADRSVSNDGCTESNLNGS